MSLIFLMFYIFNIYIRPAEWVQAVMFWRLTQASIGLTGFAILAESLRGRPFRLKNTHNLLMLALLACIPLSHLYYNLWFMGAYEAFLDFGKVALTFLLIVNVLNTEARLKITVWFIIACTLALALQGIQQWNTGIGWGGAEPLVRLGGEEVRVRWIGIFGDPNDLALGLVVGIGLLLALVFEKSPILVKAVACGISMPLFTALYYTGSRGGYLALGATCMYFFLRRMKYKILGLILGVMCMLAVITLGPARMATISVDEASAYGRIDAWYEGIQMFKWKPLFGVGYRNFLEHHPLVAHNSYVHTLAELGFFGLLAWISLIYTCFRGLWTLNAKDPRLRAYYSGLEASLFGYMSASYFLSRAYVEVLYIMLGVAAAFAYTFLDSKEYRYDKRQFLISIGLTIGVMLMVFLSMRISLRLIR